MSSSIDSKEADDLRSVEGPVLVLVGQTAIGKTELSLRIARTFGCEIVSVDSMQVYRYMDIGTAKVGEKERREITHHLIDIVTPDQPYHAARFVEDALQAIGQIQRRGAIPLLTGGTGLYLRALQEGLFVGGDSDPVLRRHLQGRAAQEGSEVLYRELARLDPAHAAKVHPNDSSRIVRALEVVQLTGLPFSEHLRRQGAEGSVCFARMLKLGLRCPRGLLYERIDQRTREMIETGLEQEVLELLARGYGEELKPMQAIGYRHMLGYVRGRWDRQEMEQCLARDTRRYAKRQATWFRNDSSIIWFASGEHEQLLAHIGRWLSIHQR